jgi:hypothetical protein
MSNQKSEIMTQESKSTENKIDPMLIMSMLESFNLDWYVKKEPLHLKVDDPNGFRIDEPTDFFATVRQDTRKVFATVKSGYEVFQNNELAELVHRVAGSMGASVSRGGSFNDGGQVYMQIGLEDQRVANDRVQRWASGINSFDGSTALRWSPETNTISCQNTFWAAYRRMENSVKHTTNMRQMVERSLKAIEALNEADNDLFSMFRKFAETEMNQANIVSVVDTITGVDLSQPQKEEEAKHSTRTLNKATDLMESITGEVNSKGRTLWGLFSGITHFTTHKAGSDKSRDKSKALGSLARTDNAVFEMLKELVYA